MLTKCGQKNFAALHFHSDTCRLPKNDNDLHLQMRTNNSTEQLPLSSLFHALHHFIGLACAHN